MLHLQKDEKIIKQVRKHWLVFIGDFLLIVSLSVIPMVAYIFMPIKIADKIASYFQIMGDATILFLFCYIIWLLGLWIVLFFIWTDYYLDVWIITNERIIDIEQKGFFRREVSSFRLDRIQDITVTIDGFIPTILAYGNLHVQTAGEGINFMIPTAAHPESVKKLILSLHNGAVEASTQKPL